jgi:tetratricopeptide (TPR) repeat protein
MYWFIPLLAFLLYANTLSHDFVLDDGIVITENDFTKKGFGGIWQILTTDSFHGFFKDGDKQNLVSGGRYRPLSVVLFAVEYQFFGKNAFLGHLFTIIWYSLMCFILLITLQLLFKEVKHGKLIATIAAIIFTIHPIHTEAVANIKGRDEILSLLFSVLALYSLLIWIDERKKMGLYAGIFSFFLGLLAKENAITFLGVIPLAIWLFRSNDTKLAIKTGLVLLVPGIVFLAIRQSILGDTFVAESMELMNNPFLKFEDGRYIPFTSGERLATIIFTWLMYLKLLFWPLVLTHDYYPRHIEMMTFANWQVILSVLVHLFLVIFAIIKLKSSKLISFAILFYFMTFSIVSNLLFPIGTNMAERFMFMPSVGVCIALAYFVVKIAENNRGVALGLSLVFSLFFVIKTYSRNEAWKDNHTLFSTDIHHSPNSAKLLNAIGGSTIDKYKDENDQGVKDKAMDEAINYLNKALKVHPTYTGADLLIGNALFFKKDFEGAIAQYRKLLAYAPNDVDSKKNLALTLREWGKYTGETLNDINKAYTLLDESYQIDPTDIETMRLLAIASGIRGDHEKVILFLNQVLQQDSLNANVHFNLSRAYSFMGELEKERIHLQKAQALDPNILGKN